jgi:hypothetical protein
MIYNCLTDESYIGKLNDSKQIIEHMKYLGKI